ncbi:hypothetical protein RMATCC62417_01014 [Rhizopus microsporus]|nr:hypothetical protein RMATCC62417_01014 [Rhizopus microsporus]CEI91368.1 hypothetical protein RMCBS344292_05663 [Rhizopus microsporus]
MNTDVKALIPDMYNVTVKVKVLDLLVSLETKHEKTNSDIKIHEYLVGDSTASVILNTMQDLEIMKTYEIQQGYTRAIEGYLRLYSKGVVPDTTDIEHVNTEHNRSFIQFNRKL